MPPIVSKKERWIVYGLALAVDGLQIIMTALSFIPLLTPFILPTSFAMDIVTFGLISLYVFKRRLFTPGKGLVLAATFMVEQIPGFEALPFWWMDIANFYRGVPSEPPEAPPVMGQGIIPANNEGMRLPNKQTPSNQRGKRLPPRIR